MKISPLWWLPLGKVPEIEPEELKRWLEDGQRLQIVDARTGLEYQQGTIGQAWHAPVTEMPGAVKRLPLEMDWPVVVLCLSGHRSQPGTRWLRAHGYQAYSLKGGILAWKQAGYDLDKPGSQA